MKKNLFVWAAGLMTLAACSNNDEWLNHETPDDKVTVTATLPNDAPGSRVALTEDNTNAEAPTIKVTWEDEESFSVIRGSENKTYSKTTEGNAFTGDAHTTTEGVYYAFYPANENATAADAMPYDLSTQTGALDEAKTYMYANGGTEGAKYNFKHLTALVKFTLTLPGGSENVTPTKVVISSDKLQPVGTVDLTDTEVTYTASEDAKTSITITPEDGQVSLTFYAYVNPMSLSDSETNTFIISMDGSDGNYYSGTLGTSVSIQANYLYAASVNMIKVEKGDYAMKNGSFMKYVEDATLTDAQKANVAGIVFWTTADMNKTEGAQTPAKLTDDEIMKADFPNCTHGLIVSLKDVSASTKWQESYTQIVAWQNSNAFNPENKSDYKSIASGIGLTDPINFILGYQNTKILQAYNERCAEVNKMLPVSLLETWEATNPAPANTTGWFIPSLKELTLLCGLDSDNVSEDTFGSKTKGLINDILNGLGTDKATSIADSYYCSSTESADNERNAFVLSFDYDRVTGNYKNRTIYVRAVCAY